MLGQVIHGYRVDRVLSADKGGFGEVFLATHVDSGAEAVVKVLRPEMSANRDMVTRFFNEARAAASIHHPGIVQIHNVGYHGDRAYLLMERLRGEDLETRLKAGPMPLDRALVFLRQATGAVAAAHERGIVHRDLKPANLFIVRDPDVVGGERIKVLDFGIAKLNADAGGAGRTQGVFGTPAYMSPEQCASSGAVDARADLYSLGCIFYELVCGRPPFGQGGIELIASHLRDTPASPRTINPHVPPAIEAIILQLLEKDPARRLQSCAALTAALEGAAAQAGIAIGTARSLPPPSPSMMPVGAAATAPPTASTRKRGAGVIVAGVVVVAAAAAAAIVLGTSHGGASGGSGSASGTGTNAATPPPPTPADAAQVAAATIDAAAPAAPKPPPKPQPPKPQPPPEPEPPKPRPPLPTEPKPDPRLSAAPGDAAALSEQGKDAAFADPPRFEEALRFFQQAYALDPSPQTLFNIATMQYQLGRCPAAKRSLEKLLAGAAPERLAAKARGLLERVADCK